MSDIKLGGTRTVLWLALLSTCVGLALLPPTCFATDVDVTMFGPKQYLRTTDRINFHSDSFRGVHGKGKVIIQNGDGNGNNLVKDALILINGMPVFDASKMNQPGYTLEAPIWMNENNWISVLLIGEPGSYLTIQAAAEITPDATTTQVIGIAGGTVSVQNHLGDTFTLQIPPLALEQDTSISISALPKALPSPIAQNLYPGAVLEPSGLEFSLPVTVTVSLHEPLTIPGALLFSVEDSNYALPTANQTALTAQNIIQGEIYHFSPPISLGLPTETEIEGMTYFIFGQPYTTPQDLLDRVNSLRTLAKEWDILGYDVANFDPDYYAVTLLQKGVAIIVASSLPADPCGQYTLEMIRLYEAMDILGCNACIESGLDQDLLARTCKSVCSLSVTWQGQYSGSTVDHNGNPKQFSGSITIPFTQNGTSVSAVIEGYNVSGTNQNGYVTLGPIQVPCEQGTSTCPAGASGTLSPTCSTFSGSFYVDRPRTISGTFSLQPTAP